MLRPLPDGFIATRLAMHRVAEEQMKPAREAVTGRFGLRATPGGFGTPPFGDVEEWHVEGTELVVRRAPRRRAHRSRAPTRRPPRPWPSGSPSAGACSRSCVRRRPTPISRPRHRSSGPSTSTSAWTSPPPTTARRRATRAHDEPYLYVGPWEAPPEGPLWNADGLPGRGDGVRRLARRRRPAGGGARVLSQPAGRAPVELGEREDLVYGEGEAGQQGRGQLLARADLQRGVERGRLSPLAAVDEHRAGLGVH